ncbi:CDP-alcohol phosphatidyltransferase family protein [Anaerosacchariphilus polymeriproducens]|uniref:CDP-alcohol phosphatidyltransferase family protein n=1 Tax=Anaerosacchariphilus polymeriproducens TaxID=1812858 RepID=A0A371AVB4_9FIRM|nr:CDP-alcohol phosphatidyltransferase family protein [Anaerosacchariphilus polymeriproducens]RDU23518.1 CDP-alcohol phosphatidyltransferase family protein [Anaerosacchariphilus polymeriproducens]
MKKRVWIPNVLTLIRVLLVFGISFLMLSSEQSVNQGMSILLITGLTGMVYMTDFFDGRLARKWNICTAFGEKFDVAADLFYIVFLSLILIVQRRMPIFVLIVIIAEFVFFLGSSRKKEKKTAGKTFVFDNCGRITAIYYYSIPFVYYLIGQVENSEIQKELSAGAAILCILLSVAAVANRLKSIVSGGTSTVV